jgi:hypothetical protein
MDKIKIAICAIMKDENLYLEEWTNHYFKIGVDKIFIYDNLSEIPLNCNNENVNIIKWDDNNFKSQSRAYLDCAKNNQDFDFIGFFDADEFYISKTMNIKKDIQELKNKYGDFNGMGVYWRIYGNTPPFEEKQPVENYKMWYGDKHIKSLVNPKALIDFPDPHKAILNNGNYIDELGKKIISPIGIHTSENMWIKHVFTRSKKEWESKMKRGDANLRKNIRTWEDFYTYNNLCIKID